MKFCLDACGVIVPYEKLIRFHVTETLKNIEIIIKAEQGNLYGKHILQAYRNNKENSYAKVLDEENAEVFSFGQLDTVSYEFYVLPNTGPVERLSIVLVDEIS